MSNLRKNWTDEETELARRLLAQDISDFEFEHQLGRTKTAARTRMQTVSYRGWRAEADDLRTLSQSRSKCKEFSSSRAETIPPEVIADAVRRSNAPRSLTAMLCGDPPFGYSAYDRRVSAGGYR